MMVVVAMVRHHTERVVEVEPGDGDDNVENRL